ncbi:MAG: carbamoyltransferase HypF [Nitrosomonas oligotropha]|uniref:Carbamoyltransferase HypF n=1 Tax=Nitrosomonas oligotropha TaxID=42354 RepID=A0A5C7VR70_9PROT|nr:MAG: carbamoyltransferase HypF [Nitrosomonas oligotropha]
MIGLARGAIALQQANLCNTSIPRLANPNGTTIALAIGGPSVLACGAWLKNTICVTQGNSAHLSPLIGDLATVEARQQLDRTVQRLCLDYAIQPEIVTHDLHPDFYSTQFAQTYAGQRHIPVLAVQHHHAHIAAICAEHQLIQPVLGLALDGVGLGTDNTPWGGELLLVDGARFDRLGHLTTLALPGGDRAAQEPWRMAAAALFRLNRGAEIIPRFQDQPAAATVAAMLAQNLNCPHTSSMGRLFDAAAGLLGVNAIQSHEAQAAIQLQQFAEQHGEIGALMDGYRISADNQLDFSILLSALIDCRDAGHDVAYGAALFHATLIAGLAAWIESAAEQNNISHVALGGGCFHNAILRHGLIRRLTASSLKIFSARQMMPDDSAIALGQAWVALQHNRL